MVVYGANGHGKSSYVDALECYFFARIGHLERENVSRAAYRHRAHPDTEIATVKVEFSNGDRNGSLSVNSARHLEFTADGSETEAFRQAAR
jgi:AAA15 family ATPase/GTPase